MFDQLKEIEKRYDQLNEKLSDPQVIARQSEFQQLAREQSEISPIVNEYRQWKKADGELTSSQKILEEESDHELLSMAREEIKELQQQKSDSEGRLKVLLLPRDPRDGKSVIMEIRAGTGGEEAGLFCADLFRMYTRYAERV